MFRRRFQDAKPLALSHALLAGGLAIAILAGCTQGSGNSRDLSKSEACLEKGYPLESPQYNDCMEQDDDEGYSGGY